MELVLGLARNLYQVVNVLGEGAYGTVHRVLHIPSGSLYAVKSIKCGIQVNTEDGNNTAIMMNKISREAVIMGNLDHPNICKLYDTVVRIISGVPTISEPQISRACAPFIKYLHYRSCTRIRG